MRGLSRTRTFRLPRPLTPALPPPMSTWEPRRERGQELRPQCDRSLINTRFSRGALGVFAHSHRRAEEQADEEDHHGADECEPRERDLRQPCGADETRVDAE